MSTESLQGVGFDQAYEALDEVFGGHPLKPALYTSYLQGTLFSRIAPSAQVQHVQHGSNIGENRFRTVHDNSQLFWASMGELYNMGVQQYKAWVQQLTDNFMVLLSQASQTNKGVSEVDKFFQGLHNAIIRDYRYFGENDKAEELERRGTADQGDVPTLVAGELKAFATGLDPQNVNTGGYRLARRLCNKERPLVLKFLCDRIMGSSWYIKSSGGFDGMVRHFHFATKFRLFAGADEIEFIENILFTENSGTKTLGNNFLQSKVGHVLLGAIQNNLKGLDASHEDIVQPFLALAFYHNWDDYLEKFLAHMVLHESPNPGQTPHMRVVSNFTRHFANIGTFERVQHLTPRAFWMMTKVSAAIHQWPDAAILNQVALNAMKDSKTGSGRSGNPNTSKVRPAKSKDTVMVERVQQGETPRGHVDETELKPGWQTGYRWGQGN